MDGAITLEMCFRLCLTIPHYPYPVEPCVLTDLCTSYPERTAVHSLDSDLMLAQHRSQADSESAGLKPQSPGKTHLRFCIEPPPKCLWEEYLDLDSGQLHYFGLGRDRVSAHSLKAISRVLLAVQTQKQIALAQCCCQDGSEKLIDRAGT